MLIFILGILLLVLLLNYMPRTYKEGATTSYDEESCQSIAKQNQNEIADLQASMKTILDLQTQVQTVQGQINANTQQLSTLADQVNKLPQ
jgi:hypothetical protein